MDAQPAPLLQNTGQPGLWTERGSSSQGSYAGCVTSPLTPVSVKSRSWD